MNAVAGQYEEGEDTIYMAVRWQSRNERTLVITKGHPSLGSCIGRGQVRDSQHTHCVCVVTSRAHHGIGLYPQLGTFENAVGIYSFLGVVEWPFQLHFTNTLTTAVLLIQMTFLENHLKGLTKVTVNVMCCM